MLHKKVVLRLIWLTIFTIIISLIIASIVKSHQIIYSGKVNHQLKRVLYKNSFDDETISYEQYYEKNKNFPKQNKEISLKLVNGQNYLQLSNGIYSSDISNLEFEFDVLEEGLYNIYIEYLPLTGDENDIKTYIDTSMQEHYSSKSAEIERKVLINNTVPFKEAEQIKLTRHYHSLGSITKDELGDEIRSKQVELPQLEKTYFGDFFNITTGAYYFYLKKGKSQTITLNATREAMLIKKIALKLAPLPKSYDDAIKDYKSNGYSEYNGSDNIKIEGEKIGLASSPNLIPLSDTTSSKITPYYNGRDIRLNVMGVYSWRLPGYWVEYEFEAPEQGLYALSFYAKEDIKKSSFVTREIIIGHYEGENINYFVPFKEASYINFLSNDNFTTYQIGDKNSPYLFPLKKGKNRIRMRVSLAVIKDIIGIMDDSINALNQIYLDAKIFLSDSDTERTYNIAEQIPNFKERITNIKNNLEKLVNHYTLLAKNSSARVAAINTMINQLNNFIKRPNNLVRQLNSFQANISSLGTWLMNEKEGPLTVDAFFFHSKEKKLKRINENIFELLGHEIKKLVYSFKPKTKKGKNILKVWVISGRDNAQIVKKLIAATSNLAIKNMNIQLELATSEVLLRAVTSKRGPDCALMVPEGITMDFSFRNALENLFKYTSYESIKSKYAPSALTPFLRNNKLFALPETQTYPVMFYRKDIFKKLNLKIDSNKPLSYEELENIINSIQDNKLNFFLESPVNSSLAQRSANAVASNSNIINTALFGSILYQMGGSYYQNNFTKSGLLSDSSKRAFIRYSEYFANRNILVEADFINRFRSGEIPAGIISYEMYNQLAVFAPEISGKWGITNVPTFLKKDEKTTANRYAILSNVPATSILLKESKVKQMAWEFLEWWQSDETQLEYGRELEVIVGSAARYPTANINTANKLPWPSIDYQVIKAARANTIGIPQVPGGYMTTRQFKNAFVSVMNGYDPIESLNKYITEINLEIAKKRKEFNYN